MVWRPPCGLSIHLCPEKPLSRPCSPWVRWPGTFPTLTLFPILFCRSLVLPAFRAGSGLRRVLPDLSPPNNRNSPHAFERHFQYLRFVFRQQPAQWPDKVILLFFAATKALLHLLHQQRKCRPNHHKIRSSACHNPPKQCRHLSALFLRVFHEPLHHLPRCKVWPGIHRSL